MADTSEILQVLKDLGLTRSEAEVYLATLAASDEGPVSGYKVAQSMGRDPANLAKTLSTLVKRGAVQVVGEKPRLYAPVPPEDFTSALIEQMRTTGSRAVSLLAELGPGRTARTALALNDLDQALAHADTLLRETETEVLAAGSREMLQALGEQFERLAKRKITRVRLICPTDLQMTGAEQILLDADSVFSEDIQPPGHWLQLVTDRKAWLMVSQARGQAAASGWWSRDGDVANMLGAVMAAACSDGASSVEPTPAVRVEPEPMEVEPEPVAVEPEPKPAPPPVVEPEPKPTAVPEPKPTPEPVAPPEPTPKPAAGKKPEPKDDDTEDGIQFIIRHDD